MPGASRIGDKDNKGDALVEGSSSVFIGDGGGSPSFTGVSLTMPVEYDVEFAAPVIKAAGRYAATDEPGMTDKTPDTYPKDTPPSSASDTAKQQEDVPEEEKPSEMIGDCTLSADPVDYSMRLSLNYVLGDYSQSALFSHPIRSQGGRSATQIVCNLQALSKFIAEPLQDQFGTFRINSGFRVGTGRKSQHERGMAMDIQYPGISFEEYFARAQWVAKNLNFDQLIFEHGNSIWLHISYDREKSTQRNQVLTMKDGNYESGLKLYY